MVLLDRCGTIVGRVTLFSDSFHAGRQSKITDFRCRASAPLLFHTLIIRSVTFHRAAYKPQDFPRDDRPQFAIVGRSNVGKSSLINSMFNRKDLARVSQTPGKTQAIQFYLVNEQFYIVDLPGYGYAKVPRAMAASWGDLTREFFETSPHLRLLFLLLDSRRVPSEEDLQMFDWSTAADVETRTVMTKVDKLSNNERANSKRKILGALDTSDEPIPFSKNTREGVDRLWREVEESLRQGKRRARGTTAPTD